MFSPAAFDSDGVGDLKNTSLGSGSRHLLPPELDHKFAVEIPAAIENFNPEEMIVTVGAATSVSQLLNHVGEHRLTPSGIQPDETGTVGGLFSDPRESPCDPFTGRFRDHVLGIEGLRGSGASILAGGRVVKNVTGYDLIRLLGGAMGALGVVTRLHLRLEQAASSWAQNSCRFDDEEMSWNALDTVRRLPFEPYMIYLEPENQRMQIILSGTKRSTLESLQLIEEVVPNTTSQQISHQEVAQIHRQKRSGEPMALRVRVPWAGWRKIAFVAPGSWRSIFPSAGFGILEKVSSDEKLQQFVQIVSQLGGTVCAEDAVAEKHFQIPLAHPSPADKLTHRLRSEWDPHSLFAWRGDHR